MIRLVNALLRYHNLHQAPETLSDGAWARAFADLRWIAETQQFTLPAQVQGFTP